MGDFIDHQLKFDIQLGATIVAVPASPCGSLSGEFAVHCYANHILFML